jgi:hypothetical protein
MSRQPPLRDFAAGRDHPDDRLPVARCPNCGYDLAGLFGDRCPECGRPAGECAAMSDRNSWGVGLLGLLLSIPMTLFATLIVLAFRGFGPLAFFFGCILVGLFVATVKWLRSRADLKSGIGGDSLGVALMAFLCWIPAIVVFFTMLLVARLW